MALIPTEACGIPGRMLCLHFSLHLETRAAAQSVQGHRARKFAGALGLNSGATRQPSPSAGEDGKRLAYPDQ